MAISNLAPSREQKFTEALEDEQAQAKSKTVKNESERPTSRSVNQSINESFNQSTVQSINLLIDQLTGPPVNRPVGFYIPKIIHKKIDEAVLYYQEKHSKKIDRSAVVSALLGDPNIWTHESLEGMAEKVISQLTSRLTSRLTD
jgi:hypothetical protein